MRMNKFFKKIRWKFLLGVFKLRSLASRLYRVRRLDYARRDIYILTDNIREYETRARSVTKEPSTVKWIEDNIERDTVLYDIGANIGAYSLIGAANGARVVAFEPAPHNFFKLNENIILNKFNEAMFALPIMLSDRNGLTQISLGRRTFGSTHSFIFDKSTTTKSDSQWFVSMTLDCALKTFDLPIPTMIKIDVDGAEMQVLRGSEGLLGDKRLQHLLVEIEDTDNGVIDYLGRFGFRTISMEKAGAGFANHIFIRRNGSE